MQWRLRSHEKGESRQPDSEQLTNISFNGLWAGHQLGSGAGAGRGWSAGDKLILILHSATLATVVTMFLHSAGAGLEAFCRDYSDIGRTKQAATPFVKHQILEFFNFDNFEIAAVVSSFNKQGDRECEYCLYILKST